MSSKLGSVLIYGSSGAQGSAIARAALAGGAHVRILLRDAAPNPYGAEVDIVRGDLDDPTRLRLANIGVEKVVLTLPLIADREKLIRFGRNAIDAAREAGVKLLVWNSTGPLPPSKVGAAMLDAAHEVNACLQASGLPSITLSPTVYAGNLTAPWSAAAVVKQGVVAYPLPADLRASWISWEDLAAFAVEALQRPDLAGSRIDVGGPEALTGKEIAAILASIVGRAVNYVPVPLADFAAGLNAAFGAPMGDELAAHYAWVQRQAVSPLAVDLTRVLAALPIRPTPFEEWVQRQNWRALATQSGAA